MKEKILNFKSIFYLITLLSIIILCNLSVVQADSNAPTECRISINNNALYTNNRYVTLDLYGVDADAMQVWISNDGENGTVVDFAYNTTYTITDQNYVVGVALDSSNSSTSTNTNNVLRVENWPLSSVNGTKKIYAVFRDAYGNKTSTSGLTTITITYDLNGVTGTTPSPTNTVKNLGIYIPLIESPSIISSFSGWSTTSDASIPNYYPETLVSFDNNILLYAIYKTVKAGDYVYYPVDLTKSYEANINVTGVATKTYYMSDLFNSNYPPVFRVLSASDTAVVLCPGELSQIFSLSIYSSTGYKNGKSAINSICAMYATNYSKSTSSITQAQMQAHGSTDGLSSLFSNWFYDAHSYWPERDWADWNSAVVINITSSNTLWLIHADDDRTTPRTQTSNVCPTITLASNVRPTGSGTKTDPYRLIIY